jgi:hypothetical protein
MQFLFLFLIYILDGFFLFFQECLKIRIVIY